MDCTLRGAAREDGRGYSPLVGLQPPCRVTPPCRATAPLSGYPIRHGNSSIQFWSVVNYNYEMSKKGVTLFF